MGGLRLSDFSHEDLNSSLNIAHYFLLRLLKEYGTYLWTADNGDNHHDGGYRYHTLSPEILRAFPVAIALSP